MAVLVVNFNNLNSKFCSQLLSVDRPTVPYITNFLFVRARFSSLKFGVHDVLDDEVDGVQWSQTL